MNKIRSFSSARWIGPSAPRRSPKIAAPPKKKRDQPTDHRESIRRPNSLGVTRTVPKKQKRLRGWGVIAMDGKNRLLSSFLQKLGLGRQFASGTVLFTEAFFDEF
jgi:hypothetical protein